MRLDGRARQVIFGVNDLRRLALGARERLEGIVPGRGLAQIDAGEEFCLCTLHPHAVFTDRFGGARGQAFLRVERRALIGIGRHALHGGEEAVGIVFRACNALQRMAADAAEQGVLHFLIAGHAAQPFGIGHLCREVAGLAQLEIGGGGLLRRYLGVDAPLKIVTNGADTYRVLAGLEF